MTHTQYVHYLIDQIHAYNPPTRAHASPRRENIHNVAATLSTPAPRVAVQAISGILNFHWRVILLPARIIDYLIIHEMMHMREPEHSDAFWQRVERILPDYADRKRWLAEEGGRYYL